MTTFTFTPEFGPRATYKPRVRNISFGDGYQQRQAEGLNSRQQSWDLTFAYRSQTEADQILAFLTARNAVEAFDWTPPYESTAIKVVCREWSKSVERSNLNTITARFEQVFEA